MKIIFTGCTRTHHFYLLYLFHQLSAVTRTVETMIVIIVFACYASGPWSRCTKTKAERIIADLSFAFVNVRMIIPGVGVWWERCSGAFSHQGASLKRECGHHIQMYFFLSPRCKKIKQATSIKTCLIHVEKTENISQRNRNTEIKNKENNIGLYLLGLFEIFACASLCYNQYYISEIYKIPRGWQEISWLPFDAGSVQLWTFTKMETFHFNCRNISYRCGISGKWVMSEYLMLITNSCFVLFFLLLSLFLLMLTLSATVTVSRFSLFCTNCPDER